MGCFCILRDVQDLLADGKTPYERRFGEPNEKPIIPFGAMVEYHPISTRDQSRRHPFGKKVLLVIFLGYALIAGGIWKGDILIADLEDLEKLHASENYPRRIKAKEVLIRQKNDEFIFPVADGTAKMSGRDYEIREPTLTRQPRTLKPMPTSGRSKVTSSIFITTNLEFNFTCRRKKHSHYLLKLH